MKKIVIVHYNGSEQLPLVLPDEKIFLYQNLHAQLENAMWAVLHQRAEIYQASVMRAVGWTQRYFDQAAPATQSMISNLPLQDLAAKCNAVSADILEVNDKVLAAISKRDNPQTVIGVFHQNWRSCDHIQELAVKNGDVLLALDRVRDPGNLGTILRTCDAVGVKGVLLIGDTTDPFSLEATRATMGSIFHVPLARMSEDEFLDWRKTYKGRVVGTHLAGAVDYRSIEWSSSPTLLLMGNEQQGLTDALAKCCDDVVIIPMSGEADSLNLAIATGVMLFEIKRDSLNMAAHSSGNTFDGVSEKI